MPTHPSLKCESASRCFQQGEGLVGAFFVIVKSSRTIAWLLQRGCCRVAAPSTAARGRSHNLKENFDERKSCWAQRIILLRGGRGVTSRHLYCNIAPPQINRNISCPRSRWMWIYFYFVLSGAAESGHNILGHIYFIGPMLRVWQLWTLRHIEETTNNSHYNLQLTTYNLQLTT